MGKLAIQNSVIINCSTERVWNILADQYIGISQWARGVDESDDNPNAKRSLPGAPCGGRICQVSGMGELTEVIEHYDPNKYELSYSLHAASLPDFVSDLSNTWKVFFLNKNSVKVTSTVRLTITGIVGNIMKPLLKRNFSKITQGLLEDLRIYAETGNVSEVKQMELEKALQHS